MEVPPYTHTLIVYEFDEFGLQWRSRSGVIVSPRNLQTEEICFGGDYFWVTEDDEGCVNYILCIDVDSGELKE